MEATKFGTDGYKLSMGNIFWDMNVHQKMAIQGRYQFVDRGHFKYPTGFAKRLWEKIVARESLSPRPDIASFVMEKWGFLPHDFVRWYDQVFYHDSSQVDLSEKDGELRLFVEGPIHTSSHHEIPILRDISNMRTADAGHLPRPNWKLEAEERARILYENNVVYSEFGGRRPFSDEVHYGSLVQCKKWRFQPGKGGLLGTSWIDYAYDLDLMIMGTMAHEYIELMAGIYGYELANKMAMQVWIEYYGKRLGYFLPDTYTTEVAMRDFDYYFADKFGGTRQDSGNPKWYARRLLKQYRDLGIKPETKSITYSNSLKTIDEILDLNNYLLGQFIRTFGLGGFITNNVGYNPYNIVLKLVAVKIGNGEWKDVVKLSDDPGKAIGKPEEIIVCKNKLRLL